MFREISEVVEERLGFAPKCFVLILADGEQAQTLFAGGDMRDFTRLLSQSAEAARHHGSRQ